ncbi:acyl-CoA thioesterase [Frigidibacter sp. MR17.14]|uniref:acyl-CoA thioesterase n=1 Tax=Frigidibacter sp. MR17.14 TaxID=3126509 RepID=UPI003012E136
MTTPRPAPLTRDAYRHLRRIELRWNDADRFGHVNNAVHQALVDSAINAWVIGTGTADARHDPVIPLVVETRCRFFAELDYPGAAEIGLRVAHLGTTSLGYEAGIFAEGAGEPAAQLLFTHVYVDRVTRRPAPIPPALRAALAALAP